MKAIGYFAVLCGLAMTAGPAFSQNQNMGSMPGMNMSDMNMQNMNGMHMMSATVTAIDNATGLTDVDAGGMKLRVHFPPASLAAIKVGDKITLHLAFSKP
jgi:predicted metal-binding membrane protein